MFKAFKKSLEQHMLHETLVIQLRMVIPPISKKQMKIDVMKLAYLAARYGYKASDYDKLHSKKEI